ncbi:uncharacterized protein F5147DRAFT_816738 [Suillus discolor]|uniref:Uncharacterized protein n=1 Tax=Suillus discolor TaxID=1912936 RepID=A0A9P7JQ02_9AGAM|nr:uncharacterized protein F5147DRAFT_816738 [Suillus discolor]KAG2097277.1 hypothetical protein F5147DRAFT_816738 [Suillus discolor]
MPRLNLSWWLTLSNPSKHLTSNGMLTSLLSASMLLLAPFLQPLPHLIPSLLKAPAPPNQTSGLALSSERVAGAGEVMEPLSLTMPLPTPHPTRTVCLPPTNDSSYKKFSTSYEKLHFPPIFSTSFGPTTLLYSTPAPALSNPMSYGEGISSGCTTGFSIYHPTIELPLDELLGEEYDVYMRSIGQYGVMPYHDS